MINVPMRHSEPLDKNSLLSINRKKIQGSTSIHTLSSINSSNPNSSHGNVNSANNIAHAAVSRPAVTNTIENTTSHKPIPNLVNPVQKGQKITLNGVNSSSRIKACLGWNTINKNCDVDVSAFMLNSTAKVIGDDWFVFYGQTQSPDNSTSFNIDNNVDREFIIIDFSKLNNNVSKIVFVLTINDALRNNLNFSMLNDAYIRILNMSNSSEIVSFKMTDYYSNVTSMMIGEIYMHNGNWKFNAIGNGVARDLAGLCELYGVQTI